jgi:3-hydroxyisobutyrate dehydrogenase-like beta-hydroxyacid dehydrogenase
MSEQEQAERIPRIGFIGFGEVASVLARALNEKGAEVAAYDLVPGKVTAPFLPLAELLARCDWILSTVTTQAARQAAESCAPLLRPGQVYLDLNSTSPEEKVAIGRVIGRSPAGFAEGVILGAVGAEGAAVRILTGGPEGRRAAGLLSRLGLKARFFSERTGQASLFKMLRSVFSKGLEALLLEMLAAARRAGLEQELWEDVAAFMSGNPFERVAENWIRTHPGACERRYHELRQVGQTLRELGFAPLMAAAAEAFFDRSRALALPAAFPEKPASWAAVVEYLAQRLRA